MLIKGPQSVVPFQTFNEVIVLAKFKLIVSDPASGKSSASELEGARAQALIGRSLGETIDGSPLGIAQSKLRITGGCDKNGIPMRADVHGGVKKYIVLSAGPGFKPTRHGERRRKLVRGRTITEETYQINFALTKEGPAEPKRPIEAKPAAVPSKAAPVKQPEKPRPKTAAKKPAKKGK
jgi:small subunit ribosomal protein S6e